mmetsp:Transcript_9486/g.27120  ORF Transcript_9486/g.27120 Transcript_9486/m.27120 type:complete len:215 (+) Transcript_9486:778-1422(+)
MPATAHFCLQNRSTPLVSLSRRCSGRRRAVRRRAPLACSGSAAVATRSLSHLSTWDRTLRPLSLSEGRDVKPGGLSTTRSTSSSYNTLSLHSSELSITVSSLSCTSWTVCPAFTKNCERVIRRASTRTFPALIALRISMFPTPFLRRNFDSGTLCSALSTTHSTLPWLAGPSADESGDSGALVFPLASGMWGDEAQKEQLRCLPLHGPVPITVK